MPLLKAFNNFAPLDDPISSKIPNAFHFESVAVRARKILSTRTNQQVHDALSTLSQMLKEGLKLEETAAIKELSVESDLEIHPMSDANALKLYRPHYNLKAQPDFPKATWEEYFAILALSKIGLAINSTNSSHGLLKEVALSVGVDSTCVSDQQEILQTEYMLEATEAIRTAEELTETLLQNKNASRIGGNTRSARYDELKAFVIAEWTAHHQGQSNREAAREIWCKALKTTIPRVLVTGDPIQRLAIWIGEHKKELNSAKTT